MVVSQSTLDAREILRKVRRVEISTRGLVDEVFSGEYHSVFKGRGMDFAEVREYQFGDDVRSIDWNVTARIGVPFVKVLEEERELTVILVVDVSASGDFGTRQRMKTEVAVEVSALLAFSAIRNNDKVGLIVFSDQIEKFVPPRKGRRHALRVIRELVFHEPRARSTDIARALEYLNRVQRKRAVAFLVSDFLDQGLGQPLAVAARRHDVIAVRVGDAREHDLPPLGFLELEDPETGERIVVDTSSSRFRDAFSRTVRARRERLNDELRRSGVDVIDIETGVPYIQPMRRFFRERLRRLR